MFIVSFEDDYNSVILNTNFSYSAIKEYPTHDFALNRLLFSDWHILMCYVSFKILFESDLNKNYFVFVCFSNTFELTFKTTQLDH